MNEPNNSPVVPIAVAIVTLALAIRVSAAPPQDWVWLLMGVAPVLAWYILDKSPRLPFPEIPRSVLIAGLFPLVPLTSINLVMGGAWDNVDPVKFMMVLYLALGTLLLFFGVLYPAAKMDGVGDGRKREALLLSIMSIFFPPPPNSPKTTTFLSEARKFYMHAGRRLAAAGLFHIFAGMSTNTFAWVLATMLSMGLMCQVLLRYGEFKGVFIEAEVEASNSKHES